MPTTQPIDLDWFWLGAGIPATLAIAALVIYWIVREFREEWARNLREGAAARLPGPGPAAPPAPPPPQDSSDTDATP